MKCNFIMALGIMLTTCTLWFGCSKAKVQLLFTIVNRSTADIKILTNNNMLLVDAKSDGKNYKLNGPLTNANDVIPRLIQSAPLKVVFNNTDTVWHYNDNIAHRGKYLSVSSKGNLFNPATYASYTDSHPEAGVTTVREYMFTPADYDFARQ